MPLENRMQLWKRKKKKIEGYFALDNPDIKIVVATYEDKVLLFGVGKTEERQKEGEAEVGLEGGKGKYQMQKALKWEIFYNLKLLPDLMPLEDFKTFAESTIAVTSADASVISPTTEFTELEAKQLEKMFEDAVYVGDGDIDAYIVDSQMLNKVLKRIKDKTQKHIAEPKEIIRNRKA